MSLEQRRWEILTELLEIKRRWAATDEERAGLDKALVNLKYVASRGAPLAENELAEALIAALRDRDIGMTQAYGEVAEAFVQVEKEDARAKKARRDQIKPAVRKRQAAARAKADRVRALRAEGKVAPDIAREVGLSERRIYAILRRATDATDESS